MKQIKLILIIIGSPILLLGQANIKKTKDSSISEIQNNIYRITVTQAMFPGYDESSTLLGFYEHRIKKSFSIVGKLGFGASVRKFGSSSNPYQTSLHLHSSLEGRYYFTLARRLRKEKSVLNFSCPYIGLEQNITTNPIALINQTQKEALKGSTGMFLNLGYQKQFGKLYLGIYFGPRLWGKSFSNFEGSSLGALHGGLSIGYVF